MAVRIWFRFIAISTLFFNPLLTWKSCSFSRMWDRTQDCYSQKVFLNEVSVYIWELTRGMNSLKEFAWVGKGFLNDLD